MARIPDATIRAAQSLLNTHVCTFSKANAQLQALLERQADIDDDDAATRYFNATKAMALTAAQAIVTGLS